MEPSRKQRIYFSNHSSTLDAAVLWAALPEDPAGQDSAGGGAGIIGMRVSCGAGWRDEVFRALLIERKKVTAGNNPLQAMLDVLDAGESLIIFPEGGRFRRAGTAEVQERALFIWPRTGPQVELVPVYLENLEPHPAQGRNLPWCRCWGASLIRRPVHFSRGDQARVSGAGEGGGKWNLRLS